LKGDLHFLFSAAFQSAKVTLPIFASLYCFLISRKLSFGRVKNKDSHVAERPDRPDGLTGEMGAWAVWAR
jgi:hypothetical protein